MENRTNKIHRTTHVHDDPHVDIDPDVEAMLIANYDTLRDIARSLRRRRATGATLMTTDLLHESWFRLRKNVTWQDDRHFLRTAALAMRHVIIDHARTKLAKKRIQNPVSLDNGLSETLAGRFDSPETIVAVSDMIDRLSARNPRPARVTTLRYFAGYTEEETADVLGITPRTVRRDWQLARAWIATELNTAT